MKKIINGTTILVTMEILIFWRFNIDDKLSYFGIWMIIGGGFFIENLFGLTSRAGFNMGGLGGNSQAANYANMSGAYSEKIYETEKSQRSLSKFVNNATLQYFIFFILNLIGFVVVYFV